MARIEHFFIMVYGSTPYVGMTPKKMVATLKVRNDTIEMSALDRSMAYQALSSGSVENRTINFAGKHC